MNGRENSGITVCARNQSAPSAALRWVSALATLSALVFVLAGPSWAQSKPAQTEATARRSAAAMRREIPVGAQSVVSATLGKADEAYRAKSSGQGYATENLANHLAAQYAADGVEIRSQNANLGFEFQGWGYGKAGAEKEDQTAVAPFVDANRVEYRRGALTEWYVNGPLGIEQGFTISQAPGGVASPDSVHEALDISLRLSGNLNASVEPGRHALTLRDQTGVETLRYGPLLAYDASGRELESWVEVQDSSLRLRVNTVGARYPVIVDPWVQAAQLTVSLTLTGSIGRSVAVGGNTVVVGAPNTTIVSNANQGAVFVFVEPTTGGWAAASTYELTASNGAAGDDFGLSVGIDAGGDTIVVGAPQTQGSGGTGVAYVFVEPSPGGWATTSTYNAELIGDDVSLFGNFGWSVGIDAGGDTVVVGASATPFGFNNPNNEKGEAYVFVEPTVNSARTWTPGPEPETAKLIASDGVAGDSLGISVGINESGDTVVAGAVDATVTAQYQGAAYVFVEPTVGGVPTWETPTTTPTFNAKLIASDATYASHLGWSVGISGNTVVAGAYQANIGSNLAQGAAYVFVDPGPTPSDWATPTTPPTFNAKLTASDGAADDEFGTSVGISGSTVVVSAASTAGGVGTGASAAYVFVQPTTGGWTNTSTSTELTSGAAGNSFGYSVGISGNTIVVGAPSATNGSNLAQGAAYVFTPTEPYAQYSPPQVSFGNVDLNAPATQTVTVTNTGSQPLVIQLAIPSADGTIFTVTQYSCNGIVSSPPVYPLTISPNGSCAFTVQFNPTALGAVNVTLGFEDNAGVGQSNVFSTASGSNFLQSLPLTGTGVTGATSIAIFSAGSVGLTSAPVGSNSSPQQLTLQNEGGAAMTVSLITVTTNGVYPNQFFISNASCANGTVPQTTYPAYALSSFSIVAGDTCTFTLGATPEVTGAITGQIAFVETAASSNICTTGSLATCMTGSNGYLSESIPLMGTGTGTPGIAVGSQGVNFPNQTLGVKATATPINVSNTGNVPLYFAAVGIAGTNAADFGETSTCSTSSPLPPTGNNVCMITVTFTPSTTAQESATLYITNSAQNTNIPLTGNGVVPTASATATVSFGLQLDSNPLPAIPGTAQSVTLTNTSTNTAVLTGITPTITPGANTNAGDFSVSSTGTNLCSSSTTLASGATCIINIVFAPSVAGGGAESATLSIADNASSPEPQTVALSGTGVSFTVGTLSVQSSVTGGQTYMDMITFTLAPGSGTLVLSCAGLSGVLPTGTTCLFSDAAFPTPASMLSIPQTNAVQTVVVTITITTTGELFPRRRPDFPPAGLLRWLALSLIAAILIFGLWTSLASAPNRQRRFAWAFLALVVLCGGWMAACGSSSSGGSTTPSPTPTGSNTFVITAKLGNLTQSINVVLNVTQ